MAATHEAIHVDAVAQISPAPDTEAVSDAGNPWVDFFEAMDQAPRDEHWYEFIRVMRERPMNHPPVERDLFTGSD